MHRVEVQAEMYGACYGVRCDEQRYPDDTGEPLSYARILSRTTLRATLLRDKPGDYYLA